MKDEDRKKIEEIMGGLTCPSSFKCAEKGFEHVCKTREAGLSGRKQLFCEDYITQKTCKFAESFGGEERTSVWVLLHVPASLVSFPEVEEVMYRQ